MSLIYLESFDLATTTTSLGQRGWAAPVGGSVSGRTALGWYISGQYMSWTIPVANQTTTMTFGFALTVNSYGSDDPNSRVCFFNGGSDHLSLNDSGLFYFWGNSSAVGPYLPVNTWAYVEVQMDTIAGTIKLSVNDVVVLTTTTSTTGNITQIGLGNAEGGGESQRIYDDLYVANGAGSINNSFVGDMRVHALLPDGNGDLSQFTNSASTSVNNYTYVNDSTGGTYVQSTDVNQIDTYQFQNIPESVAVVHGVQSSIYGDKTDAGSASIIPITRVSGTNYAGTGEALSFGSSNWLLEMQENDPATSSPWTVSTLGSAQFGIESGG